MASFIGHNDYTALVMSISKGKVRFVLFTAVVAMTTPLHCVVFFTNNVYAQTATLGIRRYLQGPFGFQNNIRASQVLIRVHWSFIHLYKHAVEDNEKCVHKFIKNK